MTVVTGLFLGGLLVLITDFWNSSREQAAIAQQVNHFFPLSGSHERGRPQILSGLIRKKNIQKKTDGAEVTAGGDTKEENGEKPQPDVIPEKARRRVRKDD